MEILELVEMVSNLIPHQSCVNIQRVVTDLAILGFDEETKVMKLEKLHPGVSVDQVRQNTGFEPILPEHITETEPPTEQELGQLRRIDIDRRFL